MQCLRHEMIHSKPAIKTAAFCSNMKLIDFLLFFFLISNDESFVLLFLVSPQNEEKTFVKKEKKLRREKRLNSLAISSWHTFLSWIYYLAGNGQPAGSALPSSYQGPPAVSNTHIAPAQFTSDNDQKCFQKYRSTSVSSDAMTNRRDFKSGYEILFERVYAKRVDIGILESNFVNLYSNNLCTLNSLNVTKKLH